LWPDGEQGLLSEGDENAERGSEEKMPGLWRRKKWLLHRDNAAVHFSLLIHDFLTKHETTLIPKPPYSPDLGPADLFLFT
jgi:hypothetical protein